MAKLFKLLLDSTEVTDPNNWKTFIPTRQRHPIYKTILSTFSSKRLELVKEAKNYVDDKFDELGTLANVSVELQRLNKSTNTYEDFISGVLDFNQYSKRTNKTDIGIQPSSFEMNLLNRDEVDLDLQKLVDMDGDAVTAFSDETFDITLDGQSLDIRSEFTGLDGGGDLVYESLDFDTTNIYGSLDFNEKSIDEIKTKQEIAIAASDSLPLPIYVFNNYGETDIDLEIWLRYDTSEVNSAVGVRLKVNEDSNLVATPQTQVTTGTEVIVKYTYNSTISFEEGDYLRIFFIVDPIATATVELLSHDFEIPVSGDPIAQFKLDLFQVSEYNDTTCTGILPWEYFLRLAQKIAGRNDCLRSSVLGRTDSPVKTYGSDGDLSLYFVTNGLNVRQFPFAQSHIISSMQKAFKQFNALEPLGLGIIYESDLPYIIIEKISYFFDTSTPTVTLVTDSNGIVWQPALDYIFGEVKAGYKTFENEENGILGTPHSPRVYSSELNGVSSKTYQAESDVIASGHLIERLRRDPYIDGTTKDSKHDNKIVLIDIKRSGSDFVRVKDEDFSTINNIENEDTQYNLRITPARIIRNHAAWLMAGLAKKIKAEPSFDNFLRFQSGQANTDLESELTGGDLIGESDDLLISELPSEFDEPLFDAEIGTFNTDMTKSNLSSIEADLKLNIEVIDGDDTYIGFIESIKEKNLETATAEVKILKKYE